MTLTKIGNHLLLRTDKGNKVLSSIDAMKIVNHINHCRVKEVSGIENLPVAYREMIRQ